MYAMGIDIGTTSLSAVLLNTESKETLRAITRSHGGFIPRENPLCREQDAFAILSQVMDIYRELTAQFGPAHCIGVTGQMHGIVFTDRDGSPLSPLYTWQDSRCNELSPCGKTYLEELRALSGRKLSAGYGAATYFTLQRQGLVPKNAARLCTICDLAAMALCGESLPVMHPSNAASLGLFDREKQDFDRETIRKCGMDPDLFPTVSSAPRVLGKTKEGSLVITAIGDNQASVLGSVKDIENTVLVNVGTGSQVSCACGFEAVCPGMENRPFIDNDYILVGAALCGGRAYASLERFIRETAQAVSGAEIKSAYSAMNGAMEKARSTTLTASTLLCGTRQNPEVRGSISGIDTDNLTLGGLALAYTEGMARELYDLYKIMEPVLPKKPGFLVTSGNAVRQNGFLRKALSDLFGLPVHIPVSREEASFGAALCALQAAGLMTKTQAAEMIQYE